MATHTKRTKPEPEEELIGTITATGIQLTRDAWRAQQAYRLELERAEHAPRRGLLSRLLGRRERLTQGQPNPPRQARRPLELRISWSSDAPLRMRFAAGPATVVAVGPGLAHNPLVPSADDRVVRPRRDPGSAKKMNALGRRAGAPAEAPARRQRAPGPEKVRRGEASRTA